MGLSRHTPSLASSAIDFSKRVALTIGITLGVVGIVSMMTGCATGAHSVGMESSETIRARRASDGLRFAGALTDAARPMVVGAISDDSASEKVDRAFAAVGPAVQAALVSVRSYLAGSSNGFDAALVCAAQALAHLLDSIRASGATLGAPAMVVRVLQAVDLGASVAGAECGAAGTET